MHPETFTQLCAKQRKSLVEQTEEITVESLLESMIFSHLEINYDSWWHHAKESITKVMLSFFDSSAVAHLLGVVIEGSPNKIVASDSIKKDLESFMTCVSKSFLSQMYDRFGFIVVFSLLFVQILTPLYY